MLTHVRKCAVTGALASLSALTAAASPQEGDRQDFLIEVHRGGSSAITGIHQADGAIRILDGGGIAAVWSVASSRATQTSDAWDVGPDQRLVTSANGAHAGRVTYREDGGEFRARFELLDDTSSTRPILQDGYATFFLSDSGNTIVASIQDVHRARDSRLAIYDRSGTKLADVAVPLIRTVQVSADGGRIAVHSTEALQIHDRAGGLLYDLPPASDFRLSADGELVARFVDGGVELTRDSEPAGRVAVQGIARDASFDLPGAALAVVDRSMLYVFDVEASEIAFQRSAPEDAEYRSVDLSPDGASMLAGALSVRKKPRKSAEGRAFATVEVLGRDGSVQRSAGIEVELWNRFSPDVRFFDEGTLALFTTRDSAFVLTGLR